MSPRLVDVVRTTNDLSAAERLFLAKILLDSLVFDEAKQVAEQNTDLANQLPSLEEVVAQIKAPPQAHNRFNALQKRLMKSWLVGQKIRPMSHG